MWGLTSLMRPRGPSLTNRTWIAATRGAVHSPGGRCGVAMGGSMKTSRGWSMAPAPAHRGPLLPRMATEGQFGGSPEGCLGQGRTPCAAPGRGGRSGCHDPWSRPRPCRHEPPHEVDGRLSSVRPKHQPRENAEADQHQPDHQPLCNRHSRVPHRAMTHTGGTRIVG